MRKVSAPTAWPAVRGRPRFFAQRPLPSRIMAIWRGTRESSRFPAGDLLDEVVGQLLDVLLGDLVIVLGDLGGLLLLLHLLHRVAADVADGDLRGLAVLLGLLDQIAAALLGQGREDQTDRAAVVLGIDAQIGGEDRLLDGLEQACVPGLDQQGAGIGRGDGRHLQKGRVHAVVADGDGIEDGGVGAARADCAEVGRERVAGLLHLAFDFRIVGHVRTSVYDL